MYRDCQLGPATSKNQPIPYRLYMNEWMEAPVKERRDIGMEWDGAIALFLLPIWTLDIELCKQ